MLTEKQINEIKEHLERAQNPIFYYDNDADGLCSFLLFRRFLGRGKGVAIRSYPDLNKSYASKIVELNADYAFVLDKPILSKEFIDEVNRLNVPLIWIDHHDMPEVKLDKNYENFLVYNPVKNKEKSDEPITYLAYKITNKKDDVWIAMMGCVADHYMPEFAFEFKEKYPNYWANDIKEAFDVYYKTEIGKIARALGFGLKDSTTHIVQLQNFLLNCKSPDDIFVETRTNSAFRKRYHEIKSKYDALIEKAEKKAREKILFFEYSGDLSMSSDIANELCYKYPDKMIVVAFKKQGVCNLSMRGKNVKQMLDDLLKNFEGASGGGHEDAVGARIKADDLERFKELFEGKIK